MTRKNQQLMRNRGEMIGLFYQKVPHQRTNNEQFLFCRAKEKPKTLDFQRFPVLCSWCG